MRCEDVVRELAALTDMRDRASLADHLSRCPSCAAWAERAARLDRLWQVTQPAEPASDVWDNVWAQVASSLDVPAAKDVVSPAGANLRNGAANGVSKFESKPGARPVARPFRSRRWAVLGLVGLAQAAAVLLVVGLSWRVLVPSRQPQNEVVASLPIVDIEQDHLIVIVADPKNLAVVDLTPKGMVGVDHLYVDWYGDERFFDWVLVYNELESLAGKPVVAMKE